jgi:hypothetical protein
VDDDVKKLLIDAHQLMLAGATGSAVLVLVEAVEGLVDRVELLSSLLVSTSPEAARVVRMAAGVSREGKA